MSRLGLKTLMGEYLAGNEVVAVQLATEFEVVK